MSDQLKPILPPHIQRMIEEGDVLAARTDRLGAWMTPDNMTKLHPLDAQLMMAQHTAMQTYLRILGLRMARANDDHRGLIPPTASALIRRGPNRQDN